MPSTRQPKSAHDSSERRRRIASRRWVEIVGGAVVSVLGLLLAPLSTQLATTTGDVAILAIAGAVATTVGGIVVSWSLANAEDPDRVVHVDRGKLVMISRSLARAAGAIGSVANDNISENPDEARAVIRTALGSLSGALENVERITGEQVEARELMVPQRVLATVAEMIQRGEAEEALEVLEEVASAGESEERFRCLACTKVFNCTYSVSPGTTKSVSCPHCNALFNAHRGGNGEPFIVQVPSSAMHGKCACPACGNSVSYKIPENPAGKIVVRYCMASDHRLEIDAASGAVMNHRPYQPDAAQYNSSDETLFCPNCNIATPVLVHNGDKHAGICRGCQRYQRNAVTSPPEN